MDIFLISSLYNTSITSQGSLNPKIRVLGQKVCPVDCPQTDRQTDRQTPTKVTSVGTLSSFQEFFLKLIIKDRPNKNLVHIFHQ